MRQRELCRIVLAYALPNEKVEKFIWDLFACMLLSIPPPLLLSPFSGENDQENFMTMGAGVEGIIMAKVVDRDLHPVFAHSEGYFAQSTVIRRLQNLREIVAEVEGKFTNFKLFVTCNK